MLNSDQAETILVDLLTGRNPRIKGAEADKLRVQLQVEIAAIEAQGGIVEVPFEIPMMDDENNLLDVFRKELA